MMRRPARRFPHGLPAVSAVVGAATELMAAGLELRALSQSTFAWKFPSIINARRIMHNCKFCMIGWPLSSPPRRRRRLDISLILLRFLFFLFRFDQLGPVLRP
jgi:hypothetical protein